MKIAYYALHYGKEYLAWSIRSIQDAVDEIHVLYTPTPSFGHGTKIHCPDSESDLKTEANRFLTKPLHWHTGNWTSEGAHRDTIFKIAKERGASQILVVDADEIWEPATAAAALEAVSHRPERRVRARFVHFWRSINWICRDPAMPERLLNPTTSKNDEWYLSPQEHPVFHFGYAQSEALMRYKISCHGHLGEWRKNWLDEKFLGWKPGDFDVHPTCWKDFWHPELTDETTLSILRPLLHDHPYWGKELIK